MRNQPPPDKEPTKELIEDWQGGPAPEDWYGEWPERWKVEEIFHYKNSDGSAAFDVVRILAGYRVTATGKPDKTIRQRHKNSNGKYIYKVPPELVVLYRLPQLLAADPALPVIIVEGEPKVKALVKLGFVATCNPMGAGGDKWKEEFSRLFVGRPSVFIWPDNDPSGYQHAQGIRDSLSRAGVTAHILGDLAATLPVKGDAVDWVRLAGNDAAKLQAELDRVSTPDIFEVLSYEDLLSLPKPHWLIEPFLVKGYVACLFGPTQTAKSFWAIDQAMRLCHQGEQVLYLAGENSAGYGLRLEAWHQHFGEVRTENFKLIRRPVNFLQEETITKLTRTIDHVYKNNPTPTLIIVDTLSKSYLGGDENDSKDMREFLHSCEKLRDKYQCTVLVIHHSPKAGGTPRGSGVILGDFDTIIEANKVTSADSDTKQVVYSCYKQKDAPEFKPITYKIVELGQHTIDASCVLEQLDNEGEATPAGPAVDPAKLAILEVLDMEMFAEGITHSALMDQLNIPHRTEPKSKSAFNRTLENLLTKKYISKSDKQKGRPLYFITPAGKDLIGSGTFDF